MNKTNIFLMVVMIFIFIFLFSFFSRNWAKDSDTIFCQEKGYETAIVNLIVDGDLGIRCCKMDNQQEICDKFLRGQNEN